MKKNIHIVIISIVFAVILWASVSLSSNYNATFRLPVRLINFPDGFASGTKLPDEILVRLNGQGWNLLSISLTSDLEYLIPVGPDSGRKTINFHNYIKENPWISSDVEIIDFIPDTLSFLVERIERKKVKILHNINIDFETGFGLAYPIKVSPDSVTVLGARSVIRNLDEVYTEEKKYESLDKPINEKINLKNIQGVEFEKNYVLAELNVQRIVYKYIGDLFVEVLNVPANRNVVLHPNKISISVRGGLEILGRLSPNDFRTYILYRDIILDTLGSIQPHIEIPPNITLIHTKPERLRYIIKKF